MADVKTSPAGATYERAHAPRKRGLTLQDVLVRLWSARGPRDEVEELEGLDAIHAFTLGLAGAQEYRLMVDAEQAIAAFGDKSGLNDEELLDQVAAGDPGAMAEFRLRRGRAQAAALAQRAAMTPEERAAEMAQKTEDELYKLADTNPDARIELKRRHTEAQESAAAAGQAPTSTVSGPPAPTREIPSS